MRFINGRYHVNPAMGQVLEAAGEAEAALLALRHQTSPESGDPTSNRSVDDTADSEDRSAAHEQAGPGPIHHVEIEATELLPTNSGRATRGFVARVRRTPAAADARSGADAWQRSGHAAPPLETHVFSDHGDLVNFLRDALAANSSQH
jgi:hypothetical protein